LQPYGCGHNLRYYDRGFAKLTLLDWIAVEGGEVRGTSSDGTLSASSCCGCNNDDFESGGFIFQQIRFICQQNIEAAIEEDAAS
jgi:hypothetical protein